MRKVGFATLIAQATVGCIVGNLVLLVAAILLHSNPQSYDYLIFLFPLNPVFALLAGTVAGFLIWACGRLAYAPLNGATRVVTGVAVVTIAWVVLALVFSINSPPRGEEAWLLALALTPGIGIGIFTNSRFRLWRELVGGGEAAGTVSRVLAAVSGLLLRLTVVLLFMDSLVVLGFLCNEPHINERDLICTSLLCGHLAASAVVLFVRTHIGLLTAISAIAFVPLVIALVMFPELTEALRYVLIGYFGLWAMFLQTRWRQTDAAVSFLNEEIHYYLID